MDFSGNAFTSTIELFVCAGSPTADKSERICERGRGEEQGWQQQSLFNNSAPQGDRRPGEPDHGAEQRDGRVEGGEQRQPQRHQQAQGQPSRDKHSTGKLAFDHLVP